MLDFVSEAGTKRNLPWKGMTAIPCFQKPGTAMLAEGGVCAQRCLHYGSLAVTFGTLFLASSLALLEML